MKPSQLKEDQMIVLKRGKMQIRFVREYSTLSVWANAAEEEGFPESEDNEIQITRGDTDSEIDAQFDEIMINNQGLLVVCNTTTGAK